MHHLAFFPWASIEAPLESGNYRIVPYGFAVQNKEISAELLPRAAEILGAYEGHVRAVDRESTPILHRIGRGVTDALDDDAVAAAFLFREQLTFAALSARDLFGHTYFGSDNLQLVIQAFAPGDTGAVMMVTRRRDGATRNIVSKDRVKEARPSHVSGRCDFARDVDLPLLHALSQVSRLKSNEQERIADIVHLWVGANTDNHAVSPHSEVVDTVGAFNRLANADREDKIVPALVALLPEVPWRPYKTVPGSRGDLIVANAAKHDEPIRAVWLRDFIKLRHPYGHGRITAAERRVRWTHFEHMCIATVVVPLAVKALLQSQGLYKWTEFDAMNNRLLDAVILLDPPKPTNGEADSDDDEPDDLGGEPEGELTGVIATKTYGTRWQRARSDAMMWPEIQRIADEMEARFGRA